MPKLETTFARSNLLPLFNVLKITGKASATQEYTLTSAYTLIAIIMLHITPARAGE